jgi:ribosomal-protein-alanine N-acetyltransferase
VIDTPRLVIAPPDAGEREELFAIWTDPRNERLTFATDPPSDAQVRKWLESAWAVRERATGELIGDCSLHFDEGFQEWELSYGFQHDRWGRGYATEAAAAWLRYGFETLHLDKIVADVDPANAASMRVLEKLGFQHTRDVDGKRFCELTAATFRAHMSA